MGKKIKELLEEFKTKMEFYTNFDELSEAEKKKYLCEVLDDPTFIFDPTDYAGDPLEEAITAAYEEQPYGGKKLNQDQFKILQECLKRAEEMKRGDYADPDGRQAHFLTYPESDKEAVFREVILDDDFQNASVDEIVDKAINRSFVRVQGIS